MIETQVVQEREGVCGGYPCVGNSRIPVRSLVLAYRALDTFERVRDAFPTLSPEQTRAALDWYIKHPERVDEDIRRNEESLREVAGRTCPA